MSESDNPILTLKAAHAAMGYGDAVVFANACHH